ncbi:hypothetical protein SMC26_23590 [Actinomadura fulvescens]|uniref:hypothetical protein n=1 Tax=Actinomadura fulvescens TaxID=46160 RepID=UPI0031CEB668
MLEELPQLPIKQGELSEELRRRLYDAFQLQARYNKPRHEAVIRVTVREDIAHTLNAATSGAINPNKRRDRRPPGAAPSFPCSVRPRQDSNLRHPL